MNLLPAYPANDLFTTDFRPFLDLPGFFPGAGGFFHGHQCIEKRFLFFGTDFGPLGYQRLLRDTGGEPESEATLRHLRSIVVQAGIHLDHCFLTNAVLCMRQGNSATDDFPIWQRYPDYVLACANWHREQIAQCKPEGIVLMGLPHLNYFAKLLFPELTHHWVGLKSMKSVYTHGKELFSLPDGTNLLLILHPSYWHAHPAPFKAKAIEHLAKWTTPKSTR